MANFDSEHSLKLHKKLNCVKRISSEIICEVGALSHFGLLNAQLVNDNRFDLLYNFFFSHKLNN